MDDDGILELALKSVIIWNISSTESITTWDHDEYARAFAVTRECEKVLLVP